MQGSIISTTKAILIKDFNFDFGYILTQLSLGSTKSTQLLTALTPYLDGNWT